MKRLYFLTLGIFLGTGNFVTGQEGTQANNNAPNIIFILVDDMGYGDVGVFFQNQRKANNNLSQPWISTPNLDKMAGEGAILTQHYTPAPVCAPSRASLLSGLNQGHTQVRDNQFDKALADNYTLGNVMQKAGYKTAVIGKWGLQGLVEEENENPQLWPAYPTKRGFDYFYGYVRHRDGHEHYPVEGIYRGKKEVWENEQEVSAGLDKSYTTDLWTAVAKKWITSEVSKSENPFFLYLAYDTPHAVLEIPTQAYPKGGGTSGGIQWTGNPGNIINTASGTPDSWMHPDYSEAAYDHDKNPETSLIPWPDTYKRYATSIRRIDNAVGDLLQLLKDLEIDSNTLVVFASDNGPSTESYLPAQYASNQANFFDSFGPYDGIKRDVLEGGIRSPVIASWPGTIPKNKIVSTPGIFYDWLPTFTNAAGLPAPVNTNGVSLLPALTGRGIQQEGSVYVEYFQKGTSPDYPEFAPENRELYRGQMQMIRFGDTVALRYNIESPEKDFGIFNVVEDTHQAKNLAAGGTMPALQKKLKAKVLQLRRPDSTAPRPYDSVPIPAISGAKLNKGIVWKAYNGEFPWLPQIDGLKSVGLGNLKKPGFEKLNKTDHDIYVFEGYIEVPKTGNYTFYLKANSKTFLKFHEINLIDGDYNYKPGETLKADILLEKGLHPFRLFYKNNKGQNPEINLDWKGPDLVRKEIPLSRFFRE